MRIKNYDYTTAGFYFVTLCAKNRKKILSNFVGEGFHTLPQLVLTEIGIEVEKTIKYINDNTHGISVDKYVIMPNHIHMILVIKAGEYKNPSLSSIIRQLKTYTNKVYNNFDKSSSLILWQRSFYDRVIRDERDYQKTWQYIETNPLKWELDEYYE